ncbi:MAG: prefoldin subunit alpha [Candidatus Micrarchaeota archaeon]
MDERKFQENVMKMRYLEQQARQVEQQIGVLERVLTSVIISQGALKDLKNSDKSDGLFPLGSGVYVKGKVTDSKNVLVDVSAGTLVSKTLEEAAEFLKEKEEQLKNGIASQQSIMNDIQGGYSATGEEMQKMQEQAKTQTAQTKKPGK